MGTRSRSRSLLLFFLLSFLLLSLTLATSDPDLDDAELSILQDSDSDSVSDSNSDSHHSGSEFDDEDEYENFDAEAYEREGNQEDQEQALPQFDEKDVAVLTAANFTEFVGKNKHVMVEFYAPWCGHCQALAPEYAAAATELKGDDVALAKVDATEESELAQKYDVEGFPTVVFFVDGVNRPYGGARSKDALVTWIKKKIGPAVENITTTEEAEEILFSKTPLVLGFFKSLGDAKSQELAAAAKLEDGVNFYQTDKPDVAKLFRINPKAKRPSLVLVKKEAEIVSHFDGEFTKSAIVDFVTANKLPLVSIFTKEKAPSIFENPIKKQLLLFATLKGSVNIMPNFMEAAKSFKGKIIFVYVEVDNGDFGKPVADYFGVTGQGPSVLAYTGNDDARKFMLGGELTLKSIKAFAQDFLEDKLKPFYKSDPVPESNDGDVKIVVGNNFDEIVLDESKDVLLEIYAPWCGHCQALEPIYNKLAKHLRSVESLVIAKMDGTTNEHPRAKPDGFPTLLFFPAGNKSFDPITVETDRTVVAFYKFLKKNAAIPFKLQKPASAEKSENAQNLEASSKSENSDSSSSKDEL